MNFLIKSSKRAIASQILPSLKSSEKALISEILKPPRYYSTAPFATGIGWKKKNEQQKKKNTAKSQDKINQVESPPPLSSTTTNSVIQEKKLAAVDWPRPSEIPWQAKVANSVNLIGTLQTPVQFQAFPDGNYLAASVIAQHETNSLRIPVIFQGDLAHIAACHLKKNDIVYIDGQLSTDPQPFALNSGGSSFQVMVNNVNFVESPTPVKKSYGDHKISVRLENVKEKAYPSKESQDDDNHESKKSPKDYGYLKKETSAGKYENLASDSWSDLVKNPKQWRDHRENKLKGLVKPKHPDFKHKESGVGIWLNKAPKWVLPELEKLEFDVSYQKSKKDDDESWKDLVETPKNWWDNRSKKINKNSPDFKHKQSGKALWLTDAPSWAASKLPPLKAEPSS